MPTKPVTRLTDLSKGRVDTVRIDPRLIKVETGFNMREMNSDRVRNHIDWLKQSILDVGVEKPLQIAWHDKEPWLVDGQCRLTAALELWTEGHEIYVPVNQVRGDEAEILATSLRANGGLPPTQMEFGERARRLINYGWSVDRIAELAPPHLISAKARKTYARHSVEMQDVPIEVKEQIKHGVEGVEVSPALALSAVKKNRAEAAETIRAAASKAKASGKKKAMRSKGEGVATKAKNQNTEALVVGDELALLVLAEHTDWDDLIKSAKKYLRLRKKRP